MCLTFEEDYQNIVILADSKMKNANRAFDLKGHLAIKSVLEKLKLSGVPDSKLSAIKMTGGYPGSSFLFYTNLVDRE